MSEHEPAQQRGLTVGHVMRAYLTPTETFIYNQINSLRRYRPVVAAHHRRAQVDYPLEEGAISQDLLPSAVARLEWLAYRAARVALPSGQRLLARYLREQDARLLHYHYLTDARFLLDVRRMTGLPAVASGYGYDVSWFPHQRRGLNLRYLRPLFDQFDCFLAMSEDMRRDMLRIGCPQEKIVVHYHGSNTQRFRCPGRTYDKDGPLTVLFCGQLEPRKGSHLVLEALRHVIPDSDRKVVAQFVGDGSLREELQRRTAAYGLDDVVTFTGHVSHLSDAFVDHYRDADIFIHPSMTRRGRKEGIPGTVVEAMAAGLPVVSTLHAGIPSVIESERNGLLVRERDVDGLVSALRALIDDSTLRARLGRAAADDARRVLDLDVRTARLERIYDRVAA
jgi:colanic acid/amylovoran biosynthesis glycosyltransferase